jgi:hypothetical protein
LCFAATARAHVASVPTPAHFPASLTSRHLHTHCCRHHRCCTPPSLPHFTHPTPHPPCPLTLTHTTCRAKAGGKQSTKDATGKFARSAGSRLRRYNEVALSRDITALLKEWSGLLAAAGLIFVAAPGSNSRCVCLLLCASTDWSIRSLPCVSCCSLQVSWWFILVGSSCGSKCWPSVWVYEVIAA